MSINRKTLLLITFIVEGGLFLLGLLFTDGSGTLLSRFSLSWNTIGNALLLCVPMFVALFFTTRSELKPLTRLRNELDEKVIPIFANCKVIDLVLIAFLAGIGEELFFRGWLQGTLSLKIDVISGILITSAIFGLTHYLSLAYAIYAGLTGLYLGAIYQISGNLYIVMLIHAMYDFVALVYLVKKGKRKKAELRTTSDAG